MAKIRMARKLAVLGGGIKRGNGITHLMVNFGKVLIPCRFIGDGAAPPIRLLHEKFSHECVKADKLYGVPDAWWPAVRGPATMEHLLISKTHFDGISIINEGQADR